MKKIILATFYFLLIGIFFATPSLVSAADAGSGTLLLKTKQCDTTKPCSNGQFCYTNSQGGTQCLPQKAVGEICLANENCLSNSCQTTIGGEKKCINPATGEGAIKFQPVAPALEINIPTLKPFTTNDIQKPDASGYIYIPFIGQYLVAIFRWALLAAGFVAVILMMAGGFIYMTAGGNKQRVDEGKERILHALWGLLLLLGSYSILYIINPGLVEFRSLKIKVVDRVNLADLIFADENRTPQTSGGKPFSTTEYDSTFQKFSACSGLNWQLYKAVAHHESALNPTAKNPNSSATGLFQDLAGKNNTTCKQVLGNTKFKDKCDNPSLTNPEVNTAYATTIFQLNADTIQKNCSNVSFQDKVSMLYYGHGMGPGALRKAVSNYGCTPYSSPTKWPDSAWSPKNFPRNYNRLIVEKISGYNITQFEGPKNSSLCPL